MSKKFDRLARSADTLKPQIVEVAEAGVGITSVRFINGKPAYIQRVPDKNHSQIRYVSTAGEPKTNDLSITTWAIDTDSSTRELPKHRRGGGYETMVKAFAKYRHSGQRFGRNPYEEITGELAVIWFDRMVDQIKHGDNDFSSSHVRYSSDARREFLTGDWTIRQGVYRDNFGSRQQKPAVILENGAISLVLEGGFGLEWKPTAKLESWGFEERGKGSDESVYTVVNPADKKFSLVIDGEKFLLHGSHPIIDQSTGTVFYINNRGQLCEYSVGTKGAKVNSVKIDRLIDVSLDPQGEHLLLLDSRQQLFVVKRDGEPVYVRDGVVSFDVDPSSGNVLFVNNEGKLFSTEFGFSSVQGQRLGDSAQVLRELARVQALADTTVATPAEAAKAMQTLVEAIVKKAMASQGDPKTLEEARSQLMSLQGDPANSQYGHMLQQVIGNVEMRLDVLYSDTLTQYLLSLQKAVSGRLSVPAILDLQDSWDNMMQTRLRIYDPTVRASFTDRVTTLGQQKDDLVASRQADIVKFTQSELVRLHGTVRRAETVGDINRLLGTEAHNFLRAVQLVLNSDKASAFVTDYGKMIADRTLAIRVAERTTQPQIGEQARLLLDNLGAIAPTLSADDFTAYPLVVAVQRLAELLPEEQKREILGRLDTYRFQASVDGSRDVDLGFTYDASGNNLLIAGRTFPVRPVHSFVIPELRMSPGQPGLLRQLVFIDGDGHEYTPQQSGGPVLVVGQTIEDEGVKEAIARYERDAQDALRQEIAVPDKDARMAPYLEDVLGEVIDGLKIQRKLGSLVALESETGTGKNVLLSMFAAAAHLPMTVISCKKSDTVEDLTFSFSYNPQKGTLRLPSMLIDALQRPGLVVLDEIGALDTGVKKGFNSAFDSRRSITIAEGHVKRTIKIHPECHIVSLDNPQHYRGVQPYSQEFNDRRIIVPMPYPPFEVATAGGVPFYRYDEVLMQAPHIPALAHMKPQDIELAWNYLKNGQERNGGDVVLALNPGSEEALERMYQLLRVSRVLRESYQKYQLRRGTAEPISQPFTLRRVALALTAMESGISIEDAVERYYTSLLPETQKDLVRDMVTVTLHPADVT